MNTKDQEKFTQGLLILAEVYNRKLSLLLLHTYWDCLKKYSFSVFETILWNFLNNPNYAKKGFPSPAEWIKAIEGDADSQSLVAWTEIIKTIRHVGHYDSVIFNDPRIHAVIKDMGGWIFLCQQSERELIFLQKEFERRYKNYYSVNKLTVSSTYLTGQIEHQNRIHGFTEDIPEPISINMSNNYSVIYPYDLSSQGRIKKEG
ncbi:MAG: hypothetical protein CFE62_006250 [Candidatus Aquirickettsiella gammari]|uniref:DUF6475 domain-containing protein n=1 Tax=Candidatus Aquirickettsiella gammari TaxID=2016198 RepID=A0A370CHY3_9COXI|nr:MAG: hypothetical protein CFE62_006250 [Candidatus Aquirickettsiella gammari]